MSFKFLFLTFCLLSTKTSKAQNILDVMNGKSVDEVKQGTLTVGEGSVR